MKVRFVILTVLLLIIIIGYSFLKFITPKMTEQDRINSELYFDHSNYNFKIEVN